MNGKRLEILFEIGELEDNHCTNCELVTQQHMDAYNKIKYCHSICNIGLKMQELGKGLKLKETKPEPPNKKTKTGVIIDLYLKGHTRKEINEMTGFDNPYITKIITDYRRKNGQPSLREEKKLKVKELIKKGNSAREISKIAGCSRDYVYKVRKGMQQNDNTNIR